VGPRRRGRGELGLGGKKVDKKRGQNLIRPKAAKGRGNRHWPLTVAYYKGDRDPEAVDHRHSRKNPVPGDRVPAERAKIKRLGEKSLSRKKKESQVVGKKHKSSAEKRKGKDHLRRRQ